MPQVSPVELLKYGDDPYGWLGTRGAEVVFGCSRELLLFILGCDVDRSHRLDHLRAFGHRYRLEQVRKMANAQQAGTRLGGHGAGPPRESSEPDEAGACHGSPARTYASISHKLIVRPGCFEFAFHPRLNSDVPRAL